MALYVKKNKIDILRAALNNLERSTPFKSSSPGSVVRAFTEAVTTELADFYDALDFNLAQSLLSTSTGRALDALGAMYSVTRKTVSDNVSTSRQIGAFYFYVDSPAQSNIVIPAGTKVYTSIETSIGRQLAFSTSSEVTIPTGRTKVFAGLKADFADNLFSAAPGTLIVHDFVSPANNRVRCTNPKTITPQVGYETDDNYRIRIIKSIRVASSGTNQALRFAALGVPGVREVVIRNQPFGLGTTEVLVVSESSTLGQQTLDNVRARIQVVRPTGVRVYLTRPTFALADIDVVIYTKSSITDGENLRRAVQIAVTRYLDDLLPGDLFVYNKLIDIVMDVDDRITDMQVTRYSFKGVPALRKNYTPSEDEQIIPGRIVVSLTNA